MWEIWDIISLSALIDIIERWRSTGMPISVVTCDEARQLIEERGALVVDLRYGVQADQRIPGAEEIPAARLLERSSEFRRILERLRTAPVIFVDTTYEIAMDAIAEAGFRRGDIFVANARDLL